MYQLLVIYSSPLDGEGKKRRIGFRHCVRANHLNKASKWHELGVLRAKDVPCPRQTLRPCFCLSLVMDRSIRKLRRAVVFGGAGSYRYKLIHQCIVLQFESSAGLVDSIGLDCTGHTGDRECGLTETTGVE